MSKGTEQLIIITARLTAKPECKYLSNGTPVCSFSGATTESYKKDDKWIDETEFHNFEAWQKNAENISQYFEKGQRIYIVGKLKTDKWEKDGAKFQKTKIVVKNFGFVEKREQQNQPAPQMQEPPVDEPNSLPF